MNIKAKGTENFCFHLSKFHYRPALMQFQAGTILRALHGGLFKDTDIWNTTAFVPGSITTSQLCNFDRNSIVAYENKPSQTGTAQFTTVSVLVTITSCKPSVLLEHIMKHSMWTMGADLFHLYFFNTLGRLHKSSCNFPCRSSWPWWPSLTRFDLISYG